MKFIATFALVSAAAALDFKPIDPDVMSHLQVEPIKLEMKTFSADDLDVTGPILQEAEKDEAELDREEAAMKDEYKQMKENFEHEDSQLKADTEYVPKLRKISLDAAI